MSGEIGWTSAEVSTPTVTWPSARDGQRRRRAAARTLAIQGEPEALGNEGAEGRGTRLWSVPPVSQPMLRLPRVCTPGARAQLAGPRPFGRFKHAEHLLAG